MALICDSRWVRSVYWVSGGFVFKGRVIALAATLLVAVTMACLQGRFPRMPTSRRLPN